MDNEIIWKTTISTYSTTGDTFLNCLFFCFIEQDMKIDNEMEEIIEILFEDFMMEGYR